MATLTHNPEQTWCDICSEPFDDRAHLYHGNARFRVGQICTTKDVVELCNRCADKVKEDDRDNVPTFNDRWTREEEKLLMRNSGKIYWISPVGN